MDALSLILDIVWFFLFYDCFRALAEIIVSEGMKKTGGMVWERKVSRFDIPIACVGIAFCIVAMRRESSNGNIRRLLLYAILIIAVSIYRSFIRHYFTHQSGL